MELRQLRHFVALAELRSFTAAAEREHIVQSGLSNSIRALERELDAELYARGTRPVRLTPAGAALVEPARRTLLAAQSAGAAVQDIQSVLTGRLRIGVVGSALRLVRVADQVAEFAAQHPAVDIHLTQASVVEMLRMVGAGELDCAFISAVPTATPRVRVTTLVIEELVLLVRDDHRLADAGVARLADLTDERFVDVGVDWSVRLIVEAALTAAGVVRQARCEVNTWELFLELVLAGAGIGFVPAGLAQQTAARTPRLRIVTIEEPELRRHIQFAAPNPGDRTPATRHFVGQLRRDHPGISD
ncbi:LysR family transcriptional regulator [Nocardia colli]|uniref:LysR family transcriptional regulator n=1 Tax=Nocardia colli TaxID=2545717 RepID=A0A5N0E8C9_9NOCA|nr:LysR family transcriptional regulator [Nocardia colli]KAA8885668.1 LysR family transcriptional regulator [Nocardia colli]